MDDAGGQELNGCVNTDGQQPRANSLTRNSFFDRTAAAFKSFNNTETKAKRRPTGNPFNSIVRNKHPQAAADRIAELER